MKRVLYVVITTHEESTTTTTTTATTTVDAVDISELRPTLVSLVNIIIDAWANGKKVELEAVTHAEGWLTFLKTGEMMNEEEEGQEKKSLVIIGPD